jgi:hypothetical protein
MKPVLNVGAQAALLTLIAACLPAQVRTQLTACGTSSSVLVGNFARTTGTVSTYPGLHEQLWSEGTFLGFSGRFYISEVESYGSPNSRYGIGLCSLRIGANTVRQRWVSTISAVASDSVTQDLLPGAGTSRQYSIGGFAVVVSGNVQVAMSFNHSFAWPSSGVIIDGTLVGNATGRTTAALASPNPYMGARTSFNLRFGRQQFQGRGEVWSQGNFSTLTYDLDGINLSLTASVLVWGLPVFASTLVSASRAAVHIVNFR